MSAPEVLLTGLVIGESARWHDGRLWFSNWGTQEVIAVDTAGKSEVMATVPTTIPFSIDWLPDGRLLVVSGVEGDLLRQEPDGTLALHADLSDTSCNEIVVDGRGNIYVNGGCDFQPAAGERPGFILLITPDGSVRRVADELAFPNGMVVTPDDSTLVVVESFASQLTAYDIAADGTLSNRRVWAPRTGDGISIDADGAIWAPSWAGGDPACQRIAEGGEILDTVLVDRACFACALGGDDGRTLFLLTADWHMQEPFDDNLTRLLTGPRTGQLLTTPAPTPKAGWP
ncbi:MAG TPA: SMP-30/gluconolactonase/LRE family protein [Kribbella sp.]|uniref:SMP-30/gluconolactonase/LRE family protein n=1 Tax=Kribbella sp. TaxID=1871183 RepID=UPI002D77E86B|nr:SMP-30/gluconolactonase/LRE family protein [Kribbella sp.]HET6299077.1 SMP-30/gluconolactonase/LRE family protein [Kribbella sp.]